MNGQHISDEDLVLYSLQSLSAGETASADLHLEDCSECKQQLAEIAGDLALISLSVEQQEVPAGARDRLMKRIAVEAQQKGSEPAIIPGAVPATAASVTMASSPGIAERETPGRVEPQPRRSWFPIFLPWAAAFAMLAVAAFLGLKNRNLTAFLNEDKGQISQLSAQADRARQMMDVLTSPAAKSVTLTEGKGVPPPTGHTSYLPDRGSLIFVGSNLKAIPAGKTYELWIIPANGKPPVPAGLFRPDEHGTASVVLPELPQGIPAKAFGVTIENAEGASSPTLPIVLSGAAGL